MKISLFSLDSRPLAPKKPALSLPLNLEKPPPHCSPKKKRERDSIASVRSIEACASSSRVSRDFRRLPLLHRGGVLPVPLPSPWEKSRKGRGKILCAKPGKKKMKGKTLGRRKSVDDRRGRWTCVLRERQIFTGNFYTSCFSHEKTRRLWGPPGGDFELNHLDELMRRAPGSPCQFCETRKLLGCCSKFLPSTPLLCSVISRRDFYLPPLPGAFPFFRVKNIPRNVQEAARVIRFVCGRTMKYFYIRNAYYRIRKDPASQKGLFSHITIALITQKTSTQMRLWRSAIIKTTQERERERERIVINLPPFFISGSRIIQCNCSRSGIVNSFTKIHIIIIMRVTRRDKSRGTHGFFFRSWVGGSEILLSFLMRMGKRS